MTACQAQPGDFSGTGNDFTRNPDLYYCNKNIGRLAILDLATNL